MPIGPANSPDPFELRGDFITIVRPGGKACGGLRHPLTPERRAEILTSTQGKIGERERQKRLLSCASEAAGWVLSARDAAAVLWLFEKDPPQARAALVEAGFTEGQTAMLMTLLGRISTRGSTS